MKKYFFPLFILGSLSINAQVTNDSIQVEADPFASDSIILNQAVVIGYGSVKKSDLTSAVSSANSKDIMQIASTTAMQSLQGKLAGVNIINTDTPGGTPTVLVRGMGTALGGKAPLYVVDGLIVPNIANINPSDIDKIDVLKDAASSAIYGVRGANGVVVITTKRGKTGKLKVNYDTYFGVRNTMNMVEMADANQYITYFNEQRKATGGSLISTNQKYNTDWFDEMLTTGQIISNNVSLSGAGESINYMFSVNNFEEKGILEGNNFKRTSIRSNNDYKLFDGKLKIKQSVSATFSREIPKPYGAFDVAYRQSPLVPVKYENGRWGLPIFNTTTGEVTYVANAGEVTSNLNSHGNPMATLFYDNQKINTTTIQGNIEAELKLTKGLTITSRTGATKYWYKYREYNPIKEKWIAGNPIRTASEFEGLKAANPTSGTYMNNSLNLNNIETFRWSWENFVTFDRKFGDHSFNVVAGVSAEKTGIGEFSNTTVYDVPDKEQYWSVHHASGDYEASIDQNNYTPVAYASYFARLQYNYANKYYVSGIIRRDGSSQFKNNQQYWGTFPSASVAWNISNEEFLKDSNTISFLKLRGGWGRLGNADVPYNYTTITTATGSDNANYVFGPGQDLVFGAYVGSPAYDVSWEIVEEWSTGLDFELFKGKVTGNLDYYNKTTKNAILSINQILSSPYDKNFVDHAAEVVNKGFEIALNYNNETSGGLRYSIGGNFNYNENEVTYVKPGYAGMTGGSLGNGQIAKRLEAGQPLGSFWLYEVEGVWQTQTDIDNNAHLSSARPGHLRYKDQNGDGVIDDRDKKFMGSYIPKFNYGININLDYKNFDLNISGYGAGGNKIYNGIKNTRLGGENITVDTFNNRWTGAGTSNTNPGSERDQVASSYYLEKGDYFRLSNITLGYNFRDKIDFVKNLRLYVSAQNVFIVTKYSGFTPELTLNNEKGKRYDGSPYGTTGMDFSAYPNVTTFLVGLNVEF
ncbi:TonB-linked outer membrane protein, SusC/RagA family [Algoriella xinjiangensis]|uniref:TonB-linked outer membrane protein, SusC/RagA family n=1 Tax=Algoriella xinjiangensis TaxID=684065 RepID=A0A1I4W5Z7_9FLAO|nr:SusC/RagA family TonB-linked outer membrane protein [Algoriella xinjiangensis]SFN09001.1 TonB-linked outer membrane protein, SusC/RagA family [Algoriella xinjiangensis]VDH15683.1 TonB-linked outer membrane protein, SusC/RagA family [Algoriella xinjiangensis]